MPDDKKNVVSLRGRGPAFHIARPADLPPGVAFIQWRVENLEEMTRFLEPFMVRIMPIPGDQLMIQGALTAMDLQISPGDCLIVHNDKLGVVRVPESAKYRESDDPAAFKKGQAGYIDPASLN